MEGGNFRSQDEEGRVGVKVQRPAHVHRSEMPMRHDIRINRARKNKLPGIAIAIFGFLIFAAVAFFLFRYANWEGFNKKAGEGSFGGAVAAIFSRKEAPEPEANTAVVGKSSVRDETEKTEYVMAFEEIKKSLDGESGSGSNVKAGFDALDQDDRIGARQHFVWAKDKIIEAQEKLGNTVPRDNERASYDRISKMLDDYEDGLDMIIGGIDGNVTAEIEAGIALIARSINDLTKAE